MKIDLPTVYSQPDAKAHPFPVQIAKQALEFMQGAVFYHMLFEMAAGQRLRQDGALDDIHSTMTGNGMDKCTIDEAWEILGSYESIFQKNIMQSVLISLRSYWDWYISHLGSFVLHNYTDVFGVEASGKDARELKSIGYKEITQQVEILERTASIQIELSADTLSLVKEMSLVRNLGLHNRWEVDQRYLDKARNKDWELRFIRTFEYDELEEWRSSLAKLVSKTWIPVAVKYNGSPDYSI